MLSGEAVYNKDMDKRMSNAIQLLDMSAGREAARERRKHLIKFLYHQRYLTRKGLSWRLERTLGADCSWWDVSLLAFMLDMWFIRKAFHAAGYKLDYSWQDMNMGFFLRGEAEISQELYKVIRGAVAKVDPAQVKITRQLTPAQRVQQGCSITDLAQSVVRYRQGMNRKI